MRKAVAISLLSLVPLVSSTTPALADAGSLDTTFGGDGKVTTSFARRTGLAYAVALQSDGKIVAAGTAGRVNPKFALARYNSDGTLDAAFGGDGRVSTDFTPQADGATGVDIQSDGKIVAAGSAGGNPTRFALARYNFDGSLDTAFGDSGLVTTDFGASASGFDVAIQADGKIVVIGTTFTSDLAKFALARFDTDGALDTTFGDSGLVTTDFGASAFGSSVGIQADGKIVVAGDVYPDPVVARYNPDGTLDASFGGDGMVTEFPRSTPFGVGAVAVQPDGRIVMAGTFRDCWPGGRCYLYSALARYNSDGTLDTTFGDPADGVVSHGSGGFSSIALQADGRIVAAGSAGKVNPKFALTRYNLDGTPDTSFGAGGVVITDFSNHANAVLGIAIQADEKIVAAGFGAVGGLHPKFALARYLAA